MERRLAAILAADVVGYSRLMEVDEAGTLARLKAYETEVIMPALERHRGRIVKRMGDGYLVEFASVVAAIECAVAWQSGSGDPITFRIGINLGDVIVEDGDLFGDGVNVAARLEGLAEPGAIYLSGDAQRQARGKVAVDFEDLGVKRLRNIDAPVTVFRLVTTSRSAVGNPPSAGATAHAQTTSYSLPRVLLAPFRHLGTDEDAKALAAGVTETLAAALTHFEEFELIDPSSAREVLAERGSRDGGRRLGATYILEGSLQIALGKARIGVQLIDAESGERVWSESIDYDLDDVFALQDDVTAFIASTMGEAVGEEQARVIAKKADADLKGYELMIRGIQHLHRVNPQDNQIARRFFEQVLALEPEHHLPAICLCWTYALEAMNGWPSSRDDALDYASSLMRDLLRHHDRSAHAHRLMGRLLLLRGDYDRGLAHSKRAYQLNPHHSDMVMSYGLALLWCGHVRDGLEKIERAHTINPYAPAYYKSYLSLAYFLAGRPTEGLEVLSSVEGRVGPSLIARIANLVALGRVDQARAEAGIMLQEDPSFDLAQLVASLAFRRQKDRALLRDALRQAGLDE